jgi:cyclase
VAFDSWRHVGSLTQAVRVYNMRDVDELIFLDITATLEERGPDFALVDDFADDCRMPLTVGGGVRSIDEVARLLAVGADKVAVNTALVTTPNLVQDIARRFGSQCVVASVDFRRLPDGRLEVYTHSGTRSAALTPLELAKRAQDIGAGEILLTSIDRDGTMGGYDIEAIREVSQAVSIPVIASGGGGSYEHLLQAVTAGGANAVAAASIFHFTQQTPLEAKHYLKSHGVPVRI